MEFLLPIAVGVLTGGIAVLGVVLTNNANRRALLLQLDHAADEANRAERRRAYADFVDHMQAWRVLAEDLSDFALREGPDEVDDEELITTGSFVSQFPSKSRAKAEEYDARIDMLWERWNRTLTLLQLVGDPLVVLRAQSLFGRYVGVMADAWNNEDGLFWDSELPTEAHLLEAMREDLGIDPAA